MPLARAKFKLKMFWNPDSQSDLILEELFKLGERNVKAHKKEREKTIATWQGARPAWVGAVRRVGRQDIVRMWVFREGEPFGQKKWGWLDEGTKVRYMHVSDDWRSKTTPNKVSSGEGRGTTTGLGFPLPGIEARNWNIIINKKLSNRLEKGFNTAVKRGLKRRRRGKLGGISTILVK
jgi:hypothetical protein